MGLVPWYLSDNPITIASMDMAVVLQHRICCDKQPFLGRRENDYVPSARSHRRELHSWHSDLSSLRLQRKRKEQFNFFRLSLKRSISPSQRIAAADPITCSRALAGGTA